MLDQIIIEHHIQRHVIEVLTYAATARFSELRPPKTDTNLFSYHLKLLVKNKWIEKTDGGYRLTGKGLAYVDRVSTEKFTVRVQPKIMTVLVVQNSDGQVLLQRRNRQPFIGTWGLPQGKLHADDKTIEAAALREAQEKLNVLPGTVRHAGNAYVRVRSGDNLVSASLVHIFCFETDDIPESDAVAWVAPLKLGLLPLAPATEALIARTFFKDPSFFAEFNEDWYS